MSSVEPWEGIVDEYRELVRTLEKLRAENAALQAENDQLHKAAAGYCERALIAESVLASSTGMTIPKGVSA